MSHYNPSNLFARARLVWTRHVTEYSPAKTGEYPRTSPNFQNCARCEKDLKDIKDNSHHLGRKHAPIFVLGHYLFLVAHSFPQASLLGTDNVRGQISKHIFTPNGHYCLYIPVLTCIFLVCPVTISKYNVNQEIQLNTGIVHGTLFESIVIFL